MATIANLIPSKVQSPFLPLENQSSNSHEIPKGPQEPNNTEEQSKKSHASRFQKKEWPIQQRVLDNRISMCKRIKLNTYFTPKKLTQNGRTTYIQEVKPENFEKKTVLLNLHDLEFGKSKSNKNR